MSNPEPDIDEYLWQLYLNDCEQQHLQPSLKDYLIWCEEQDYDREGGV